MIKKLASILLLINYAIVAQLAHAINDPQESLLRTYPATELASNYCFELPTEGLLGETLVKTSNGYKIIKALVNNDVIIGYSFSSYSPEQQKILSITKKKINYYIKIITNDLIIGATPCQKFYLSSEKKWTNAANLRGGQYILRSDNKTCCILGIEVISESTDAYALTVESHHFFITEDDILVHNADPATISATTLAIGAITAINPVIAILGISCAMAATIITYKALNTQYNIDTKAQIDNIKKSPNDFNNYEHKKQILLELKEKFIKIVIELKNIKNIQNKQFLNFTYEFLQHIASNFMHSAINSTSYMNDNQLDEIQKKKLQNLCQQEVQLIEKEIQDLQITIALHFNELLERLNRATKEIDTNLPQINHHINLWNNNPTNIPLSLALTCYEHSLIEEEQIDNLEQKNNELSAVINYYKIPDKAIVIKDSTNIIEIINDIYYNVARTENYIAQNKKRICLNKQIYEQYLLSNATQIKNIKESIQQKIKNKRRNREFKELQNVENQKTTFQYPKGPKKDDKEEKHPYGIYKGASYHHPNSQGLKSCAPKDGQTALDNSVLIKNTSSRRVGVSKGEIVILDRTSEGVFHGHVRTWNEILKSKHGYDIRKALIEFGLVDKFGKIL